MASQPSSLMAKWHETCKIQKSLEKQLERANQAVELSHAVDDGKWDALEDRLAHFRFCSVSIIFESFGFASRKDVQKNLWLIHSQTSVLFRGLIASLQEHVIVKRKLEIRFARFLKTSILFYEGYIQRLSLRFDIPDLHRVARTIKVESGPTGEKFPELSDTLRASVLASCHETLIELGDLSRYRLRLRKMVSENDKQSALTFYSLANDLIAEMGHGFHGMGLTHLMVDKHFDAVYYFYRAVTCQIPHPNAMKNLEEEFKQLRKAQDSGETLRATPMGNLETWFTKLHAHYFTGASFTSQVEIETQVFELLYWVAREPGLHTGAALVKMALINMSAYWLSKNLPDRDAPESVGFRKFAIRVNVAFLSMLCFVVIAKLQDVGNTGLNASSLPPRDDPTVVTCAAALRLYSAWLCTYGGEIAEVPDNFQPVLQDAWERFASVLNLLDHIYGNKMLSLHLTEKGLASSPYMLDEDEEILSSPVIGEGQTDGIYLLLRDIDTDMLKPHFLEYQGARAPESSELVYRIADMINCAKRLVNSCVTPLTVSFIGGVRAYSIMKNEWLPPPIPDVEHGTSPEPSLSIARPALLESPLDRNAGVNGQSAHGDLNDPVFSVIERFLGPPEMPEERALQTGIGFNEPHPNLPTLGWDSYVEASPTGRWTTFSAHDYYGPPGLQSHPSSPPHLSRPPIGEQTTVVRDLAHAHFPSMEDGQQNVGAPLWTENSALGIQHPYIGSHDGPGLVGQNAALGVYGQFSGPSQSGLGPQPSSGIAFTNPSSLYESTPQGSQAHAGPSRLADGVSPADYEMLLARLKNASTSAAQSRVQKTEDDDDAFGPGPAYKKT